MPIALLEIQFRYLTTRRKTETILITAVRETERGNKIKCHHNMN